MDEAPDDEFAVGIADNVRMPGLVAVELPLAVKPTERGIQAGLALIGGIEELSKVTADEEKALKLHARPKDPLCRPLVARRNGSEHATFVFKVRVEDAVNPRFQGRREVKRRRLRPRGELEGGGGGNGEDTKWSIASVDAVGAVHTNFSFHSLADAQFLSCRPKDVGAEESIDEHIEAAATRSEPMELVPSSFLPSFTKVSQQSREEKLLRREKKDNAHIKIERGGLLVYHRFGEAVKHRTKNGNKLMKDAKEVAHLRDKLEQKWGAGRLRGRKNRPSRFRQGISGHNEVREQQLLLVQKLDKLFEKQPMYFMRQIEHLLNDQPVWPIRDLVPAVAYYYCNGPWRSRWVRFGYRPEDHPTDRFEQLLEFRVSPAQLRVWADALEKKPKTSTHTAAAAPPPPAPPLPRPAKTASATGAAPPAASASATSSDTRASSGSKNSISTTATVGSGSGSGGSTNPGESGPRTLSEQNQRKTAEDLLSGVGGPTAVAAGEEDSSPEEGAQVAEAEREEEEEEDGDGAAGGSGGQETGDGDSASPGFGVGGVVPDLWLTSKTKGRFASQVVVNGGMLSARNRVLVRESPIREVQELALKSARLDRPGIVTGWWQQSTIDKFRLLTLEGLSSVVKFKKEQLAAAAVGAEGSKQAGANPGTSTAAGAGAAAASKKNPLPANMTRKEFEKAVEAMDKKVKVVKAPTAAASYGTAVGGGDEAYPGGAGQPPKKNKGIWPGTGGRSGTGRSGGSGSGAKQVAGRKRPAPALAPGGGGGGGTSRDVDAATVRSGDDSDDETETDSVNSSDLVDGTGESSWNSQDDELSDEGSGERLQQEEDDEEDAEDDDDDEEEEEENAAEQGAKDARSGIREPLGRGGGAGGAGHEADAPRKVGSSRRANN